MLHFRRPNITEILPKMALNTNQSISELCYGSQYVDGVGYNADPKSCSEFIQCFYEGGQIKVEKARCPFRMFWDQRLLLCRPATSISCWRGTLFVLVDVCNVSFILNILSCSLKYTINRIKSNIRNNTK
jgi:hypothetical protein